MLTGKLRNQVDKIWEAFWTGGITNPISVIEQFSYLLFIRRLDDIHTLKEKAANAFGTPIDRPVFTQAQDAYRWNKFKNMDTQLMFELVRDKVFPFIKTLHGAESSFAQHMKDAIFMIPKASLLDQVEAEWDRRTALGVVMAAANYPDTPRKGDVITGLPHQRKDGKLEDAHVFHAGTAMQDGKVVTSGGRVLCVVALGDMVKHAQNRAYEIADGIKFDGCQMRRDIGYRAIGRK